VVVISPFALSLLPYLLLPYRSFFSLIIHLRTTVWVKCIDVFPDPKNPSRQKVRNVYIYMPPR
jgi:hypothetical protein